MPQIKVMMKGKYGEALVPELDLLPLSPMTSGVQGQKAFTPPNRVKSRLRRDQASQGAGVSPELAILPQVYAESEGYSGKTLLNNADRSP